jgi:hypothetical protein
VTPVPEDPFADPSRLALLKPAPTYPTAAPSKHLIHLERGGSLTAHEQRFKEWAADGGHVEIRGMCQSACTLVMSYVPRERICFSKSGYLNFHLASYDGHNVVPHCRTHFG